MTTSIVPANTPFEYNLGVNYETWENGRTGRSISADLDRRMQNVRDVISKNVPKEEKIPFLGELI